jgi:hypothetical protein
LLEEYQLKTDPVLVQAAKLAEWKLNSPMFERNAMVLSDTTTDPRACLNMAVALIGAVLRRM